MRKQNSSTAGFTIVELLIVIVVIAILATISIVAYSGIQARARTSAHQAAAAQTERSIMAHALQVNSESISLGGTLIGYKEGAGTIDLLKPLTGTPDITMYVVYTVTSTSDNWPHFARLTPSVTGNAFLLQTGPSGGNTMSYRIDTSAAVHGDQASGYRVPGNTVIGWLQVSGNGLSRAYGYNRATPHLSTTLAAHTGWNFTGLQLQDIGGTNRIALVFNAAHDQTTRAQVIDWLAQKYGVSL